MGNEEEQPAAGENLASLSARVAALELLVEELRRQLVSLDHQVRSRKSASFGG